MTIEWRLLGVKRGDTGGSTARLYHYSSLDQELAEHIVDALRLATDVDESRIFCSSIEGYGSPRHKLPGVSYWINFRTRRWYCL